jgi:hypothetical protein
MKCLQCDKRSICGMCLSCGRLFVLPASSKWPICKLCVESGTTCYWIPQGDKS